MLKPSAKNKGGKGRFGQKKSTAHLQQQNNDGFCCYITISIAVLIALYWTYVNYDWIIIKIPSSNLKIVQENLTIIREPRINNIGIPVYL